MDATPAAAGFDAKFECYVGFCDAAPVARCAVGPADLMVFWRCGPLAYPTAAPPVFLRGRCSPISAVHILPPFGFSRHPRARCRTVLAPHCHPRCVVDKSSL